MNPGYPSTDFVEIQHGRLPQKVVMQIQFSAASVHNKT
jgi:hypothetical protein